MGYNGTHIETSRRTQCSVTFTAKQDLQETNISYNFLLHPICFEFCIWHYYFLINGAFIEQLLCRRSPRTLPKPWMFS